MKKRCSKCGIKRDVSEFGKDKSKKDGLPHKCKECRKLAYENNKKKILKKKKKYIEENKDKIIENRKKYYEENKDKFIEYREKNKDKFIENRKKYYEENKDKFKEFNKKYREKNRDKFNKQRKEYRERIPEFSKIKDLLTVSEKSISDENGLLKVLCTYCDRYFYPRAGDIEKRIRSLSGQLKGENKLFCSNNCKKSCPIFRQHKYPKGYKPSTSREVQPELRKMRLKLDNYECQKCGKSIDETPLHCHHYTGTVQNPIESADVDNTVTVCKKCHKWVHTQEGCRYFELRCGKKEK